MTYDVAKAEEFFAAAGFGRVFGALALGTQLASGLGPWAVGFAYDRLGGYTHAFEGLAAISVLAALLISRLRPSGADGVAARASPWLAARWERSAP